MPQVVEQKNSDGNENFTSTHIFQADEEDIDDVNVGATLPDIATNHQPPVSDDGGSEEMFIQALRNGDLESLRESQSQRFIKLETLYSKYHKDGTDTAMGSNFVIEKLKDRTHYTRMASVYRKNMYNKFFVPVWSSAFDEGKRTGYVLYPKLTPVKEMLYDVKRRDCDEDMSHAVRLSILPVALGVEALHTPVLNRRNACCHRDICIDNTLVSRTTARNDEDEEVFVYGEAMLKISRFTRVSREMESIDQTLTMQEYRMNAKYFHHPEPFKDFRSSTYYKRYDWFSVGAYILEVLGIALDEELDRSAAKNAFDDRVRYYLRFADKLTEAIERSQQSSSETYKQYIAIAKKYMENDKLSSEQAMTHTYNGKKYYFEYGLHQETAELLGIFDDVRRQSGGDYQSYQDVMCSKVDKEVKEQKGDENGRPGEQLAARQIIPEKMDICQACLLRPSVSLKMRAYRRGALRRKYPESPETKTKNNCDDSCNRFYCGQCYMNGERMFCPLDHGTASSVIGHYSSFALILYGEEYNQPGKEDLFKQDAECLSNVLKHKMIVGLHKDNVLVRPVFSKKPKVSAKKCLESACNEMKKLIHWKQLLGANQIGVDECRNDTDYCLFIFYSGHGRNEKDSPKRNGSWVPTATLKDGYWLENPDYIEKKDIHSLLDTIVKCENDECSGSRIEIMYVMDHCFTSHPTDVPDSARPDEVSDLGEGFTGVIATQHKQTAQFHPSGRSDITHWFCSLLRCTFMSECKSKLDACPTCDYIKEHVQTRCSNAFLDGQCLKWHEEHMKYYGTAVYVQVDLEMVVSRFHRDGVHYRVFPFKEEHEPIEIDFELTLDYDNIREEVLRKVKERYGANGLCLLTNNEAESSKYGLVWADDVQNKLESASETSPCQLFYHVIKEPLTVTLCDLSLGENAGEILVLDVDRRDVCFLINDHQEETTRMNMPPTDLPHLLVHILHHLYHHKGYKDRLYERQSSTDTKRQSSVTNGNSVQASESGASTQVNGSDVSKQEKTWSGFVERIYRDFREVQLEILTEDDWRRLEDDASQYWNGDRKRPFEVEVDKTCLTKVRITWDGSDATS